MKQYKAFIFDMDGTTLNTLDDLRVSMNYALEQCGHAHDLPNAVVRDFFGSGVTVAVTRALAYESGVPQEELVRIGSEDDPYSGSVDTAEITRIEEVYRPHYAAHCQDLTAPYPGIPEAIRALRERGIRTAVVSNKPDGAVQDLVRDLFDGLFDFSLGEVPGVPRKPAPDMVIRCLEALDVSASDAVYIGDSEIDLETAAASGLDCLAVSWGFRSEDFLKDRGASPILADAGELVRYA